MYNSVNFSKGIYLCNKQPGEKMECIEITSRKLTAYQLNCPQTLTNILIFTTILNLPALNFE